jgi:hypothetical protein
MTDDGGSGTSQELYVSSVFRRLEEGGTLYYHGAVRQEALDFFDGAWQLSKDTPIPSVISLKYRGLCENRLGNHKQALETFQ